jgi:serine/threonine-protein kinase PknG
VKLRRGDLVAGQYEVSGVLGHGGQGWVYLAHDTHVDRRLCVLKGRRDTGNPGAAEAEELERRALAELHNPAIVEIYNFVEQADDREADAHAGTGKPPAMHRYIVMAYANGRDLRYVRRACKGLEATRAVAYVYAVLPALGYLHEQGFVYCDLKPENMIHSGDAVILVDLGAAWNQEIRRAHVFSTAMYEAPEWPDSGPTVATDIYAVGRTLVALLTGDPRSWPPDEPERSPAGPAPVPPAVLRRHDGLRRFVERACAPRPEDRFADADETAEALLGVLCQVAAATDGDARPLTSGRWGPPRTQLEPFGWDSLPTPILPAQPFGDRSRSADHMSWADRATRALAQCGVDDVDAAAATVEGIDPSDGGAPATAATGAAAPPTRRTRTTAVVDTARTYLRAIVRQAAAEIAAEAGEPVADLGGGPAVDLFRTAYHAAPGELACALALAAAIEAETAPLAAAIRAEEARPAPDKTWIARLEAPMRALLEEAELLYRQVAVTNPNWVGAIAGRARALVGLHRPMEAALALLEVSPAHPLRLEALALACDAVPSGEYDARVARAAGDEIAHARARTHRRPIEEAELAAAVYRMACEAALRIDDVRDPVTGEPAAVEDLAAARAAALHDQAMATPTASGRHALLDEAAQARPWRTWR